MGIILELKSHSNRLVKFSYMLYPYFNRQNPHNDAATVNKPLTVKMRYLESNSSPRDIGNLG